MNETYIFDSNRLEHGRMVHTKSRVYRICNRQQEFQYFLVEFTVHVDGAELASGGFADFEGGAYMGIPQTDLDRALTRVVRL